MATHLRRSGFVLSTALLTAFALPSHATDVSKLVHPTTRPQSIAQAGHGSNAANLIDPAAHPSEGLGSGTGLGASAPVLHFNDEESGGGGGTFRSREESVPTPEFSTVFMMASGTGGLMLQVARTRVRKAKS